MFQEVMAENCPNLTKIINLQETPIIPQKISAKRFTPRYNTVKLLKAKDRENLKSSERKHRGIRTDIIANFVNQGF